MGVVTAKASVAVVAIAERHKKGNRKFNAVKVVQSSRIQKEKRAYQDGSD